MAYLLSAGFRTDTATCAKTILLPAAGVAAAGLLLTPGLFVTIPPVPEVAGAPKTSLLSRIFTSSGIPLRTALVHALILGAVTTGILFFANRKGACSYPSRMASRLSSRASAQVSLTPTM